MILITEMLVVKKQTNKQTHLVSNSRCPTACLILYMDYFIFLYNKHHEIGNSDYPY